MRRERYIGFIKEETNSKEVLKRGNEKGKRGLILFSISMSTCEECGVGMRMSHWT